MRSLNRQFHRLAGLAGNLEDDVHAAGRGCLGDLYVHLVEADETGRQTRENAGLHGQQRGKSIADAVKRLHLPIRPRRRDARKTAACQMNRGICRARKTRIR